LIEAAEIRRSQCSCRNRVDQHGYRCCQSLREDEQAGIPKYPRRPRWGRPRWRGSSAHWSQSAITRNSRVRSLSWENK
jgi:hypothetical protein